MKSNVNTLQLASSAITVAILVACGGTSHSTSDEALNRLRNSGGDARFSLIDETKAIRDAIEDHIHEGPLAFSQQGRYIDKLVSGCYPTAKYQFRGSRPTEESHKSRQESKDGIGALFTGGVIGADEKSSSNTQIRVVSVGRYLVEAATLGERVHSSECEAASSVILEVEVGAWEIDNSGGTVESGTVGGEVGLQSVSDRNSGSSVREGDFSACGNAKRGATAPPDACAVPLRAKVLETTPITATALSSESGPIGSSGHAPGDEEGPSGTGGDGIGGEFIGFYSCGRRQWEAALQIAIRADGSLQGFVRETGTEASGSWGLEGALDENGDFELDPADPIDGPDGYSPVGFRGHYGNDRLSGVVAADNCSEFVFKRP